MPGMAIARRGCVGVLPLRPGPLRSAAVTIAIGRGRSRGGIRGRGECRRRGYVRQPGVDMRVCTGPGGTVILVGWARSADACAQASWLSLVLIRVGRLEAIRLGLAWLEAGPFRCATGSGGRREIRYRLRAGMLAVRSGQTEFELLEPDRQRPCRSAVVVGRRRVPVRQPRQPGPQVGKRTRCWPSGRRGFARRTEVLGRTSDRQFRPRRSGQWSSWAQWCRQSRWCRWGRWGHWGHWGLTRWRRNPVRR